MRADTFWCLKNKTYVSDADTGDGRGEKENEVGNEEGDGEEDMVGNTGKGEGVLLEEEYGENGEG